MTAQASNAISRVYPSYTDLVATEERNHAKRLKALADNAETFNDLATFLNSTPIPNEIDVVTSTDSICLTILALPTDKLSTFTSFLRDLCEVLDHPPDLTFTRGNGQLICYGFLHATLTLSVYVNIPADGILDLAVVPQERTYTWTYYQLVDR